MTARPGRSPGTVGHDRRGWDAALLLAWLAAAVLILAAARGDLWLDEIWSLSFAGRAGSALDVLTRFHHDNNHPLNTLFLYLLGPHAPLLAYRLPSVLAGMGSVALAGLAARRAWGREASLIAVILTGTSYPLLLYFSEARGYAPAILFALAAYVALRGALGEGVRPGRILLFWGASALGLLSSLSFMTVSLAFAAWHFAHELSTGDPVRRRAIRLLSVQLPPFLFLAWLSVVFVRDMTIGAGPVYGYGEVLGRAAALLLGLPAAGAGSVTAAALVITIVVVGTARLRKERDTARAFFPAVLLLAPALVLLVVRPRYLYVRYFVVCFPFFVLLVAYLLGRIRTGGGGQGRRSLVALAVLLLVALQAPRVVGLLERGRGAYRDALAFVLERSPGGIVRIGGDNDFRNRMVVEFYAARLPDGDRLRYVERADRAASPPEWMLTHSQDPTAVPPARIDVPDAGVYRLAASYPFSGISGWSWFVYRRARASDDHPNGGGP